MSDPLATGLRFNRAAIFAAFKQAVRHVWVNADFVLPVLHMGEEEPKGGVLAAVVFGGKVAAVDDHLLRRAERYVLLVSDDLLLLPAVEVRRILIHEAAHLGHHGHGADFRRLVAVKGGVIAGAGVDSGGMIEAQKKVGARFKTMRTFPQDAEREATAWTKEQAAAARAAGTPERWRLQWA